MNQVLMRPYLNSKLYKTIQEKWDRDHTGDQIIGNPKAGVRTRKATQNECLYYCFLSQIQPKRIDDALINPDWIVAMQYELNQFERN